MTIIGNPYRPWLTFAEVARELAVSRSTVQRWVRECQLPVYRPSGPTGKARVNREELEHWLIARREIRTDDGGTP